MKNLDAIFAANRVLKCPLEADQDVSQNPFLSLMPEWTDFQFALQFLIAIRQTLSRPFANDLVFGCGVEKMVAEEARSITATGGQVIGYLLNSESPRFVDQPQLSDDLCQRTGRMSFQYS